MIVAVSTQSSKDNTLFMSFLDTLLPKRESENYFAVLGVSQHHIIAIVAYISGNSIEVKGFGESEFAKDGIEIEAADIALSTAEKNLPENILVTRVIFAINSNFLTGTSIEPQYLERIQKISKELSLSARGFIEYPEALSYYFERQEGSPPTAIFLALEKHQIIFSLVRVGKVHQSGVLSRSDSFMADFTEILPKFQMDILPSRIILYDHHEKLEAIKEELLRFPWHKHSSFLHTPKIEIVSSTTLYTALVEAASSSFLKEFTLETEVLEHPSQLPKAEEKKSPPPLPASILSSDNLSTPEETFGFIKGTKEQYTHSQTIHKERKTQVKDETSSIHPTSISSRFPSIHLLFFSSKLSVFIFPFVGILTLLGLVYYFVFFYPKATVALIVYPLVSTQQIDVVLSTKETTEGKNKYIIPASLHDMEVSGKKTMATTGKTSIGEKAKGEVTIYNKTLSTKTFPKGTVILHNELTFTLESEVTVASASDTGEGLSFGKNTIRVTAAQIGPDSNISAQNSFVMKDLPDNSFNAKNTQAFSGGTSREVPSVSKEDEDKLISALTAELISQAKTQLAQKIPSGEKIIDNLIKSDVSSKKLSLGVGSEAKEVALSLTIKIHAYAYKEIDLSSLAKTVLISAPTGFSARENQTSIHIEEAVINKDGTITAKGEISAYFMPQIDTLPIQKQLVGKSFDEVATSLSAIENVAGVRIFQEVSFPLLKKKLPLTQSHIVVKVVPYLP